MQQKTSVSTGNIEMSRKLINYKVERLSISSATLETLKRNFDVVHPLETDCRTRIKNATINANDIPVLYDRDNSRALVKLGIDSRLLFLAIINISVAFESRFRVCQKI